MSKFCKHILMTTIMLFILLSAFAFTASAEGSRDLVENGGFRPYLEWNDLNIANIPRRTTLEVYVKAGETVYFGSSVTTSFDGNDIVVIAPSGDITNYDVTTDSGFIKTTYKEKAGPKTGAPESAGGYPPLSFTASETGIWKFQFHSPRAVGVSGVNPPPLAASSSFPVGITQYGTVSAWDISVYSADGTYIPGRVFTNCISLNLGANNSGQSVLNSVFYVLTKDGYLYETDANGLDPFGFMFFANNRGIVDDTTGATLNHNAPCISVSSESSTLDSEYNLSLVNPSEPDDDYNITHRVFFNVPATDLPVEIPTTAEAPSSAENFIYTPSEEGTGGSFSFDASRVNTYSLTLAFADGTYKDIVVNSPGIAGTNTFSWDGCDADGVPIPAGSYSATLKMKSGEYHFTLIDSENNPNGIKIKLLNAPYAPDGYYEDILFYNAKGCTVGNGKVITIPENGAPSPLDASADGLRSSLDTSSVLKYTNTWGNNLAVDLWTYFPGEVKTTTFIVAPDTDEVTPPAPLFTAPLRILTLDFSGAYIFGYEPLLSPDGELLQLNMAPEDAVTREQVCAMLYRILSQKYEDVQNFTPMTVLDNFKGVYKSRWSYIGISYLNSLGAFDGKSDLLPWTNATRGEVARLVACALKLDKTSDISMFFDVMGNENEEYINRVLTAGYMHGMGDGSFEPNKVMTRAEYCSMFNKILGRSEENGFYLQTAEGVKIDHSTYYFTDLDGKMSSWYYKDMLYATSIFGSDGYADIESRLSSIRNILDRYDGQRNY